MLDRMFLSAGSAETLYVEDVFSTYLYTGNGSTQTITNGIDLSGKGGLVWIKCRTTGRDNLLTDTVRGSSKGLISNDGYAEFTNTNIITSFSSAGFSLGSESTTNASANAFASWTFRKAPKFFDVVTYTGTGSARTIPHSLGVAPGCIIIKRLNAFSNWPVYHRSQGVGGASFLNTTTGSNVAGASVWSNTAPTATEFSVGSYADVNASGGTYVAYLFAHDTAAGNVIQCGSYIGNGSSDGPAVTLGWEPQWLLICGTGTIGGNDQSTAGNWQIIDNMRGMPAGRDDATLQANLIAAESPVDYVSPTGNGFKITSTSNQVNQATSDTGFPVQYNYVAIRRGPMKTPTSGTSVFSPFLRTGTGVNDTINVGFTVDTYISKLSGGGNEGAFLDRLRGPFYYLRPTGTNGEAFVNASLTSFANNTGVSVGPDSAGGIINFSGWSYINWVFKRAPGFFDVVCYTGTSSIRTVAHNLGVAPELMIVKRRDASAGGAVYVAPLGNTGYLQLFTTNGAAAFSTFSQLWNNTSPTSTSFTVGSTTEANLSGSTYVAYLFASCPGVSKVGSYTGNGSSQTINCGFSAGARFFLVKRTDVGGDGWYVWDTARGITAPADPALLLNTAGSAVTGADAVDPDSSGIIVNQETTCNINVNGGTYIFLAIA